LAFSTKALDEAIQMGWKAVNHYDREQDRLQALTSLAGVFVAAGALDAAESAFEVVAERLTLSPYRLFALSGLATVAAYRGDGEEFERRISVLESAGFAEGPASFRAEAWIERGKGYRALGNRTYARRCSQQAVAVGEDHRLGQHLLEAEALLLASARDEDLRPEPRWSQPIAGMEEIQTELRRMREAATATAGR
jgi:hypothetical protein